MKYFDVIIIGAGIIGLSTALKLLQKKPHLKIVILEKEKEIATQQTGHNSGVVHSGIYYKPGSLKAENCVKGAKKLLAYCDEKNIPYNRCGKIIVATKDEEIPRLHELARRGKENGVQNLKIISKTEIEKVEPICRGLLALHAPDTAIIDFVQVAEAYLEDIQKRGGTIFFSEAVKTIMKQSDEIVIQTSNEEFSAKFLINCSGAQADKIANLSDEKISSKQIIPFRGEYYYLSQEKAAETKGLIYPVPDPKFPFLGVHITRKINGKVEAGPNAVLALSRYGYRKKDIELKHCKDLLTYPGFWKMSLKYWKMGMYELYRSMSKRAFLKSLQELAPNLKKEDLTPGGSGVRSQVVLPNGKLLDDFMIHKTHDKIFHVINAPSPAATASLSIGEYISEAVLLSFS